MFDYYCKHCVLTIILSYPFMLSRNFENRVANGTESNGLNLFLRINNSETRFGALLYYLL